MNKNNNLKQCSVCKNTKDIKGFCKKRDTKDGLKNMCVDCSKQDKRWRRNNKGLIRIIRAIEYVCKQSGYKYCPTCQLGKPLNEFNKNWAGYMNLSSPCKICQKEYKEKNKNKISICMKKYNNRPETKARRKNYKHSEKGLIASRNNCAKRRAIRAGNGEFDITNKWLLAIKPKEDTWCALCGNWNKKEDFELDHLTPISRGGAHTMKNVFYICKTCNNRANKGTNTLEEFIARRT